MSLIRLANLAEDHVASLRDKNSRQPITALLPTTIRPLDWSMKRQSTSCCR